MKIAAVAGPLSKRPWVQGSIKSKASDHGDVSSSFDKEWVQILGAIDSKHVIIQEGQCFLRYLATDSHQIDVHDFANMELEALLADKLVAGFVRRTRYILKHEEERYTKKAKKYLRKITCLEIQYISTWKIKMRTLSKQIRPWRSKSSWLFQG